MRRPTALGAIAQVVRRHDRQLCPGDCTGRPALARSDHRQRCVDFSLSLILFFRKCLEEAARPQPARRRHGYPVCTASGAML